MRFLVRCQLSGLVIAALVVTCVASTALGWSPAASAQQDETFRIVIIPDTQIYVQTEQGAAYFADQTRWIADTASDSNTVFVSHVGDVVQNPNDPTEWDRAEVAMSTLDAAGLPYGIAPGNHDLTDGGAPTLYDERFAASRFASAPWFGGRHEAEGNRSSFQTVSVEGHELLFVHLRHLQATYGDVDAVLDWADGVLAAHPDHLAFVTTHEFTAPDNSVVKPQLETMLQSHCTVAAVFSGHRFGTATAEFTDVCDRPVRHLLTNYQGFNDGGEGYLRTIDIDPITLEASFAVYSPTLDLSRAIDPAEQFTDLLSPLPPVLGDVNCDRSADVIDALFITQFDVTVRSAWATCPLPSPLTQLNTTVGDFNRDGAINVVDALQITQCEVGVPNSACPG